MNYLVIGVDPATHCGLAAELFDEDGKSLSPMVTSVVSMATVGGDDFDRKMRVLRLSAYGSIAIQPDDIVVFGVESYGRWNRARACQSKSTAIYNLLVKQFGKQIGRGKMKVITAYRPKPQEWQPDLGYKKSLWRKHSDPTKAWARWYFKNVLGYDVDNRTGDEIDAALIMQWTKTVFFKNLKARQA